MGQEPVVEVDQPHESAQLTMGLWLRKVTDSLNFLRKGGDPLAVDVMAEKIQLTTTEEALVGIDDNAMFSKSFKNQSQVFEVFSGLWLAMRTSSMYA